MLLERAGFVALALVLTAAPAGAQPAAPGLSSGTISVQLDEAGSDGGFAKEAFVGVVEQAFADRGFTVIQDAGHAKLVAVVTLHRTQVGVGSAKVLMDRSTILPGSSPGVGAGLSLGLPTNKLRIVPLEKTQVDVRVHRLGVEQLIWKGSALTVRADGTARGADRVVASDLIGAILQGYPEETQDMIAVP